MCVYTHKRSSILKEKTNMKIRSYPSIIFLKKINGEYLIFLIFSLAGTNKTYKSPYDSLVILPGFQHVRLHDNFIGYKVFFNTTLIVD